MAIQMDQNGKDDLKTQFATREGTYRLMTLSEYSRPNRVGYQTNQNNPQVRVSLVTLPTTSSNLPSTTLYPQHQHLLHNPSTSTTTNATATTTTHSTSNSSSTSAIGVATIQSSINNSANNVQDGGPLQISSPPSLQPPPGGGGDRICFNFGKELYVYAYRGCKKVSIII